MQELCKDTVAVCESVTVGKGMVESLTAAQGSSWQDSVCVCQPLFPRAHAAGSRESTVLLPMKTAVDIP